MFYLKSSGNSLGHIFMFNEITVPYKRQPIMGLSTYSLEHKSGFAFSYLSLIDWLVWTGPMFCSLYHFSPYLRMLNSEKESPLNMLMVLGFCIYPVLLLVYILSQAPSILENRVPMIGI